jgi:hypothetical protein
MTSRMHKASPRPTGYARPPNRLSIRIELVERAAVNVTGRGLAGCSLQHGAIRTPNSLALSTTPSRFEPLHQNEFELSDGTSVRLTQNRKPRTFSMKAGRTPQVHMPLSNSSTSRLGVRVVCGGRLERLGCQSAVD